MSRERQRHRREDEIANEVLEHVATNPCATPLALSALEQLATGAMSPEEAERVHTHLGQCLSCLSAFTRAQSLLESPSPVDAHVDSLVESIEQGRPIDEKGEPVLARLQQDVQSVLRAVRGTARSLLHRATQRRMSDPALALYLRHRAFAFLDTEESTAGADAATLLESLNLAIRAAEESLEEIHALRHLLTETQAVQAKIQSAEVPPPMKHAFTAQLAAEYQLLEELVQQATALYGPTRR
jgi:hypothetical protein